MTSRALRKQLLQMAYELVAAIDSGKWADLSAQEVFDTAEKGTYILGYVESELGIPLHLGAMDQRDRFELDDRFSRRMREIDPGKMGRSGLTLVLAHLLSYMKEF